METSDAANEGVGAGPRVEQEQEIRDAAYWSNVHKMGMALIDKLVVAAGEQAKQSTTFYVSHLRTVLDTQGQEIVLFRELENAIRTESLTEESCKDIFLRLDQLRAETALKIQAKNTAASEGKAA